MKTLRYAFKSPARPLVIFLMAYSIVTTIIGIAQQLEVDMLTSQARLFDAEIQQGSMMCDAIQVAQGDQ